MFMKSNNTAIIFCLAIFLGTGLFFAGQNARALSTASISTGVNPIVSSNCSTDYTVPSGSVLIVTDFVAYGTSSGYYGNATILKDGAALIKTGGLYVNNPASVASFHTGFKAEANTVISCSTRYASMSWSGYLAQP